MARLKVLAELLTYRTDVPQEGRIRDGQVEMRVSTFPTLYGEKAVVRLFASSGSLLRPADLGLPPEIAERLCRLLGETSGAILVTGPAGSGKTTTLYACLRELAAQSSGRSLASLEDPIEVAVPGVAQSQVNPAAGFDLATGLRFLLRQDPEVIMVGEIRDPRNGRSRVPGLAHRPPGAFDVPRRQRGRLHQPLERHGHRAVSAAQRHPGDRLAAAGSHALLVLRAGDGRSRPAGAERRCRAGSRPAVPSAR